MREELSPKTISIAIAVIVAVLAVAAYFVFGSSSPKFDRNAKRVIPAPKGPPPPIQMQ